MNIVSSNIGYIIQVSDYAMQVSECPEEKSQGEDGESEHRAAAAVFLWNVSLGHQSGNLCQQLRLL